MKPINPNFSPPQDAHARRALKPTICYPADTLHRPDIVSLNAARSGAQKINEMLVPPRDAQCIAAPAGSFFRITCTEGSQVGDLNLWNAADLQEHFFSGKTRALHGTHLSTGDRLWSRLPSFRPMRQLLRTHSIGTDSMSLVALFMMLSEHVATPIPVGFSAELIIITAAIQILHARLLILPDYRLAKPSPSSMMYLMFSCARGSPQIRISIS
jgi:Uncharacterized conserved protein